MWNWGCNLVELRIAFVEFSIQTSLGVAVKAALLLSNHHTVITHVCLQPEQMNVHQNASGRAKLMTHIWLEAFNNVNVSQRIGRVGCHVTCVVRSLLPVLAEQVDRHHSVCGAFSLLSGTGQGERKHVFYGGLSWLVYNSSTLGRLFLGLQNDPITGFYRVLHQY